ncbi:MAG: HAMP domain-containing histidine kinase [Clostridium sp.]|uniref:sensor histidine kinase n=1 Tax=Clostridium sp. TaxID=1506 RepID=UPI002579F2DC|nr:HAMP domain-containing sensor histidine kinase [Clostridium sp.]MBS6888146.1 HAMP domain-containing histidine kinase [Clostridium sp.]
MIKIKKIKLNLILGVLVAFLLYQIIISEGYAILVARQQSGNINLDVPVQGINFVKVFAFAIFLATIIIFNTKRFRKINFNILAGIEIVIMLMRIILVMCPNVIDFISNNYLVSINSVYFIILLGIGTFLFVFLTLVNRKVKYIKFLTKEVKRIKDDGFGKTIEVKGNDELAQLCDSINNMSLELGEKIENEKIMEKNKSELITNVSHDLRTPLTSIIGYVDLLKKNGFQDKDKFKEYIDVIDERTRSLNKLINELFEYTKLTSHDIKLNYSKVEIGSLVEQLVGEYTPIFNREGLEVYKDISSEDIFINIDVEKIVRVLENLLTNAKKYSLRNDKVLVTLYKEDDEYVVISLANKTKSIDKDELNNIFECFYKVDKSRKEQDSAGLGLSIVKRIVELHNGEVNAELDNDVIEFIVKLPLK